MLKNILKYQSREKDTTVSSSLVVCSELARDEESQRSKCIPAASGHFIQMLVEVHGLACTVSVHTSGLQS